MVSESSLIVSDYLFDVPDKTILKNQGKYFVGGIQQRNIPVVVLGGNSITIAKA